VTGEAAAGLSVRLAGRVGALDLDLAFTVAPRSVTGLIGPSGAGKTTLLRCVAGLTRLPGRIEAGGEIWQDQTRFLAPHRRAVGYVFQEASLLAHLSVRENLRFGLKRCHAPIQVGFDEVVELLALAPLLERAPTRLSGGERQRAAIGRALLSQPRLLLLDEPLANLDPDSRAEIMPFLERIRRALAIPMLYVSHDAAEIRRLADQVLSLRAGRLTPVAEIRAGLDGLTPDQIAALALAALEAGLTPRGDHYHRGSR
jgi:molybdate transport system ATP-binding protein